MLKEKIQQDLLLKEIINRSNFTFKQLDYLLIQQSGNSEEKIFDKMLRANKEDLSKSSFVITRDRGRKNLKRALYSLIIAKYLGLLSSDCFLSLEKTVAILENAKDKKLNDYQSLQIVSALEDLIKHILLI
ncbi:MAG: hypothetical protein ABSB40_07590 [Nitrososphaeria archaeon]|jgi:hypothetical protein